jgi:hypothetical protein
MEPGWAVLGSNCDPQLVELVQRWRRWTAIDA